MNNSKHHYFLLISVIFFTFLYSCSDSPKTDSYSLILVETSDVHGAIFDYDFVNDRNSSGSLSKVHSYVKELRGNNNVILMDNGDILQGQPVVYYYNFENTSDKHICSEVMNYMEYDVATIGNHDIEAGPLVYDKLVKDFNFPWLAANAIDTNTGEPYFEPYTIINKDGFKIAVFGLITPGIPKWLPEKLWSGMEFEDMIVTAKKWIPLILETEEPNLIVGLFHAGYDYKYGNNDKNTYKNENASVLVAEQVPGFDVIFIGHDHRTWNNTVKNINGDDVLILGPGAHGQQVATATVEFNLDSEGKYEKNIKGNVVEMSDYKADSLFNLEFEKEFKEVKDFVSKQVGVFEKDVYAHKALYGPSEFLDLIHEVQFIRSNADISFAAPLSFNAVIEKGPVYVRDMFKLYRYENFLYTINLTGSEIDKYLEYSFAYWFNTMNNENDHLLYFKRDNNREMIFSERYQSYQLEKSFYNFDVASGINYTIDITRPINEKVTISTLSDGREFFVDSTYTVAVNSYRANGGGGHFTVGVGLDKDELSGRIINSTNKDIRYFLMRYIEDKETIDPKLKNEWAIIPKDWWEKAKNKDEKLLNSKN